MHSSRMRSTRSSGRPGGRSPPGIPHDQAHHPGADPSWSRHLPWDQVPRGTIHPPLWTEWQTGATILPCTKLRLPAVIISRAIVWDFYWHVEEECLSFRLISKPCGSLYQIQQVVLTQKNVFNLCSRFGTLLLRAGGDRMEKQGHSTTMHPSAPDVTS